MVDFDIRTLGRYGFVRLDGVLDPLLTDQALQHAEATFALDGLLKDKYRRPDEKSYGFMPFGTSRIADGPPDHNREYWDIGNGSGNRFPSEVPGFAPAFNRIHCTLERLAHLVLARIDREFGTSVAGLAEGSRMPMRINHYRAAGRGEPLFPSHRDFSLVTLYAGSSADGLEFDAGGTWIPAEQKPGSVHLAFGSILRQYNRGLRAVQHRVVGTGQSRISVSMFVEPNPEVVLPSGRSTSDYIKLLMSAQADD